MNTPKETIEQMMALGRKKYDTPWIKIFILGLLAGAYIAMGGLISSMSAAGFAAASDTNPFLPKLIAGATFPVGLMLVVIVGAELFTGNTAYLMPATYKGVIPRTYFLKNWIVVLFANVLGALLFDYLLVYKSGIMSHTPYVDYIVHSAEYKTSLPWFQVFLRGIGANWLVCLAVWLGYSSKTMLGRIAGIWWPVMTFVAIGYEHSVANLFYIPTGIMYGANLTWWQLVTSNLIPAILGNIIGGAIFVGICYTYLYGTYVQAISTNSPDNNK